MTVKIGDVEIYPPLPGDLSPTLCEGAKLMLLTPQQVGQGWQVSGKFGELISIPFQVVMRRTDGIVVLDPR